MSTTDIDAELRDVLRAISNDGPLGTEHVDELCSRFIESFRASESEQTDHFNREERDFRERCYKRWRSGLDLLQVFRHFCAEVGSLFQKEFYRYGQYRHDTLLGVLMRQHANACRIAGEVEALLRCGQPPPLHGRSADPPHLQARGRSLPRGHRQQACEVRDRRGRRSLVRGQAQD